MVKSDKIALICSDCGTRTEFEDDGKTCRKCGKSLAGKTYKKAALSLVIPALLGVTTYGSMQHWMKDSNRYSVTQEYALIDTCMGQGWFGADAFSRQAKLRCCVEALEKTQVKFDEEEAHKDQSAFLDEFWKNTGIKKR